MYIYIYILYVLSWKTNFVCGVIKNCCGMEHSSLCNCCKLHRRIVYFEILVIYYILGMIDGVWIFVSEIGVSTLHCDTPEHCLSISIFFRGRRDFQSAHVVSLVFVFRGAVGVIDGYNQWGFQDPKMEVLYHIRFFFFLWGYSLKFRPYIDLIYGIGTSVLNRILKISH